MIEEIIFWYFFVGLLITAAMLSTSIGADTSKLRDQGKFPVIWGAAMMILKWPVFLLFALRFVRKKRQS